MTGADLGSCKIQQVMTQRVATLRPDSVLQVAVDAFNKHSFHHLPVIDSRRIVRGMVSDRDLLRISLTGELDCTLPVGAIMTPAVATIAPEDTLEEAANRMSKFGINCLAVVDQDRRLLGIVTSRDLVSALTRAGRTRLQG